jgi:2-polyprenyl-6-hydroxyphenyl methylase/3-demethylubiquinone-9 3-methyltransferase
MGMRWKLAQWAELRWWQNYLAKKNPDEYLRWKRRYWREFLAQFPDLVLQSPFLDAGCGPAGIFMVLAEEGQGGWALDPLLLRYEAELPDVFQAKGYPQLRFEAQALEEVDLPEGYFANIFCLNAINHVRDLEACLARLWAALAPGGYLLLSTDVHRRPWLKAIFQVLPGDVLHPQQHSQSDYEAWFRKLPQAEVVASRLLKSAWIFDYRVWLLRKGGD